MVASMTQDTTRHDNQCGVTKWGLHVLCAVSPNAGGLEAEETNAFSRDTDKIGKRQKASTGAALNQLYHFMR